MLNIGDIALIGLKADNPDDFAFAALVDIPEGETIRFTDNGIVAGGALATSEAVVEWTSPAGGIAAGSVIGFDGNLDFALLAGSLGLSTSGDQIIAFQGEPTAPSFLFSLQSNSTAFQDGASDSNSSGLPAGLTFGVSALAMGAGPGAGDEYDNIHYAGPLTGTRAAILSAIADPANWVGADAPEGYAAPAAFTVEPTLPFNLQITEIWSGNNPGGNLTADWFELTNTGGTAWTAATDGDIFFDDDSFSAIVADRLNGIDSIAPGETVIYVGDVDTAQFIAVWGEVIDLGGVQIGTHDGSGLGGGGDAVTLFREAGTQGDATLDAPVLLDFERYPDASAFGGRSWDVNASAFSSVATGAFATAPNDEGQAAIGTPGNGGAPAVPEAAYTLELLHISDQEAATGAISDAPGMSAVLNSLRAQDLGGDGLADNTLTLSSGDSFIPGVFFKASETAFGSGGIADIQIQNELGIQAIGLGNHEFDFGTSALGKLISGAAAGTILGADFAGAAYPYLSTNLSFASDINLAPLAVAGGAAPLANSVTSSVVINVGGENIGIVGATTPTLGTISVPGALTISPDSFDGTPTDAQLDALAAVIQAEVDALLTSDPTLNKVILLAHMQRLDIEASLAARLVGVDIIVGGGSNTRLFDANDTPRSGDSVQGVYPQFIENAGGTITALVNTDGSYKYVGRLVLDFDAEGNVIPSSYDADVSGAYATDAAGVAALGAEALIDPEIQAIVDAIEAVVIATESNVFGLSDVFLNGNRSGVYADAADPDGVRTQETNLGALTADANLAAAQAADATVVVSIKNGGGIRASIGEDIVPAGGVVSVRTANAELLDGDGAVIKPAGGISQNDIATSLAFNNALSVLTMTRGELVAVLEHGVSGLPAAAGAFPQVAGLRFSYDDTLTAGARILNAGIFDADGGLIAELVRDGSISGDASATFRVVTLSFLADGGDGYPFPTGETADRIDLAAGETAETRSGAATFANDGTEQDALAEYLAANFSATAYAEVDTGRDADQRIQNVSFRGDAVFVTATLPSVWINEIDSDTPGTDAAEFIELYDGGVGGTDLTGLSLVLYNGSNDLSYAAFDLDGYSTDADGFFVIGSADVANVDLIAFTTNGLQNGADAAVLVVGDAADFASAAISALDLATVVDAVVYDTDDGDDTGLLTALGRSVQDNEAAGGDGDNESLSRLPDGSGDFVTQAPTPGQSNVPGPMPTAPAPAGAGMLTATVLSTSALVGAEIVAFDPGSARAFVTSGAGLSVIDLTDPSNPVQLAMLHPSDHGFADAITSVSVKNGLVAVAVPAAVLTDPGHILFFGVDGTYRGAIEVGALPDMVTFDDTGAYVLVANEGQSSDPDNIPNAAINPDGSVSVIAINAADPGASVVTTLGFEALNGQAEALRAKGVRINDLAPSVAADLEPEYIAIVNGKAFITLQENNAYAIIQDIAAPTAFTLDDIVTAGTVDHSIFGNGMDSSDRDDGINIETRMVTGLRMPDGVSAFQIAGVTYFAGANEGDDRGTDVARAGSVTIDAALTDLAAAAADATNLGRLNISTIDGDGDGDGDYDQLFSFGSRSFTIYDEAGAVVFDSGDLIERIVAAETPAIFNGEDSLTSEFDRRSDNKGPEPESVVFGEIDGKPYLFVGLERASGVMVFDITDPSAPVYEQYLKVAGDMSPEGLRFISAEDSPTGKPLLAIANEVSNTMSVIELNVAAPTLISAIQGSSDFSSLGRTAQVGVDDFSPYVGQTVTIEAVVTADYQTGGMNGFYVQEETADSDGDAFTSEGIFVFDPSFLLDVALGDLVRVTGVVSEFGGLTEITAGSVSVVASGVALPDATAVTFPTVGVMLDASGGYVADLEAVEGMIVTIPTDMTVTELFNLDRFGEYVVSSDGRLTQFTQNNAPDVAGYDAHLQSIAARSVTLDDGSSFQNPAALEVIDGNDGVLGAGDSFRMGDTLGNVTGVVSYGFDAFRVQDAVGEYTSVNPRADAPSDTGTGFKVASLNVLNYFTTLDDNTLNSGPNNDQEARGANSALEFERQAVKLVNEIVAIDADVLGLMEIENDDDIAIADLVARVNAALGADVYGYIAAGDLGGDAITQGLIYKLGSAIPVGDFAALTTFAGQNFLDPLNAGRELNRPALAQTFEDAVSGERLVISVNHFKSKGSLSGLAADQDQGDGAGNNNATRAASAAILANWLASDPTGQGAANVLIVGDLNAYAKEDPIVALAAAGFTDVAYDALGTGSASYVFDGQTGTLDYQLANAALLSKVIGVTQWDANSAEADAFDYNLNFGRDPALFDGATSARASDHDPVIVTFGFAAAPIVGTVASETVTTRAGADVIDISQGGTDVIAGTIAALNGDTVTGFGGGDAFLVTGAALGVAEVAFDGRTLTLGGAAVDLGPDMPNGRFTLTQTAGGTEARFERIDPIAEVRSITIGTTPITLTLGHSFAHPVAFALPTSLNGGDAVTVRIMSVVGDQITLKLQEPNKADGIHAAEDVTLFVVEAGTHTLADGTVLEAGTVETNKMVARGFESVAFADAFDSGPAVMTQVQTNNGTDYVVTRQTGADATGFRVTMQEEEGNDFHAVETVGWFAIETGAGSWSGLDFAAGSITRAVNGNGASDSFDAAFETAPNLIASISSLVGRDTVVARTTALTADGFTAIAQEDTSFDAETTHGRESLDWLAIEGDGLLFGGSGVTVAPATVGDVIAETGRISVNHLGAQVTLEHAFAHPVVIATVTTTHGAQEVIARISNVTATGFFVALQEPGYLDGTHAVEDVSFMVVEAGTWKLADGTILSAGLGDLATLAADGFDAVSFEAAFSADPTVLAQVQTVNGADFVKLRLDGVDAAGFDVALEQAEGADGAHGSETFGWVAIERGAGVWTGADDAFVFEAGVTGADSDGAALAFAADFAAAPVMLGGIASYVDADAAELRMADLTDFGAMFRVEEDKAFDIETTHAMEDIAWIAIGGEGLLTGLALG